MDGRHRQRGERAQAPVLRDTPGLLHLQQHVGGLERPQSWRGGAGGRDLVQQGLGSRTAVAGPVTRPTPPNCGGRRTSPAAFVAKGLRLRPGERFTPGAMKQRSARSSSTALAIFAWRRLTSGTMRAIGRPWRVVTRVSPRSTSSSSRGGGASSPPTPAPRASLRSDAARASACRLCPAVCERRGSQAAISFLAAVAMKPDRV